MEFITKIGKESTLSLFWGWEVKIQKNTVTMVFILTYKRMT